MHLQGSFELDVETLEAEGKGCEMDYLDIQVISARRIGMGHCAMRAASVHAARSTPAHLPPSRTRSLTHAH